MMRDSNELPINEAGAQGANPLDDLIAPETKLLPKATIRPTIRLTDRAKKVKKTPTFSIGEMLPWKGVWFKVSEIDQTGIKLQPVSK